MTRHKGWSSLACTHCSRRCEDVIGQIFICEATGADTETLLMIEQAAFAVYRAIH